MPYRESYLNENNLSDCANPLKNLDWPEDKPEECKKTRRTKWSISSEREASLCRVKLRRVSENDSDYTVNVTLLYRDISRVTRIVRLTRVSLFRYTHFDELDT